MVPLAFCPFCGWNSISIHQPMGIYDEEWFTCSTCLKSDLTKKHKLKNERKLKLKKLKI